LQQLLLYDGHPLRSARNTGGRRGHHGKGYILGQIAQAAARGRYAG
jgi:hypothetical protein